MVHINCQYNGRIPGIGKGPLINVTVSDIVFKQLQAQGFPVEIINTKEVKKPVVKIISSVSHAAESSSEFKFQSNKEPVLKKELKPKEEISSKIEIDSSKKYTEKDLEKFTDDELKLLIPKDTKFPPRYGRNWLIRNIVS